MRILCVGLNHKTAPVALREKLAFDAARRSRALSELAAMWPEAEFAILSTCNRSEVYAARPVHGHPREEEIRRWLGEFHGVAAGDFADSLYAPADAAAAEHLFAVTAGLDSLVPGEAQIVAQVKDAYAAAVKARAAGAVMNELFQKAFRAAKSVRSRTKIASGKTSVASAAIDCVTGMFDTLKDKCVLNVGAGKMNELMLARLGELGAEKILLTNRSASRGRRLAAKCGAKAVAFGRLGEHLAAADVVLTSTAAEAPIITRKMVQSAQRRRAGRAMLIVDIAVPRDVEPGAGEAKNVHLYNIDDLERIVRKTLRRRRGEQAKAEAIIAEHVEELMAGLNVRNVAPTIDALYARVDEIAAEELAAARKKLASHDDADADVKIIAHALRRALRRMLHPCARNLRRAAGSDAARAHVAALRKLFELDE